METIDSAEIKILVVDDHPDVLHATARLLEKAGYRVHQAANGEEALAAVQRHRPDLLLLDRDLPGLGGLEVCRRIKQDRALADIIVILASGTFTESDQRAEGLESGADGCIPRPIAKRELLALVKSYVRIRHLSRSLQHNFEELEKAHADANQTRLASLNLMEDALAAQARLTTTNQKLQAALAEAERFRAAMDQVNACVYLKDVESRYIYANQPTQKLFGLSAESLVGCGDTQFFPRDTVRRMREIDARVFRGEQTSEEVEVRDEQGQRRVYWEVKTPIYADAERNEVSGLLGISTDITERKQMEEALEHSQHLLAQSEAIGKVGGWEFDIATQQLIWTKTVYAIHELEPNLPITVEQGIQYYTPASRPIIERAVQRAIEQGETFDVELEIITAKGNLRSVHAIGHADLPRGKVFGFFQDITERKRAETALRKSEELFSLFMQHSPIYTYIKEVTATESRVLEASDNFMEMLGIAGQDMMGKTMAELFPPAFAAKIVADDWAVVTQGEVLKLEEELHGRHYATIKFPVTQGDRTLLGGYTIDITERVQAETAMLDSEARFRATFEQAAVGMAEVGLDGAWLRVNQRICDITGYAREELLSKKFQDITHPDDLATDLGRVQQMLAGEIQNYSLEKRCIRKDQSIVPVNLTVALVRAPSGAQKHFISVVEDITARKQAEAALRESEARYHQLFELESDAIVLVDCETLRYVDFNQSAQRLYGYSREELLQMSPVDVSTEPEKTRAVIGSGSFNIPLRWHRKKSGEFFAAELTGNQIIYQGRWTDLTTIRDVTARQRVLAKLQDTTRQLLEAQRIASLGSYVFNIPAGTWTSSEVLDEVFGIGEPGVTRGLAVWVELIHPQDRAEMQRYMTEEVLTGQKPFDRAYRIIRPHDQAERWVHGLGKVTFDASGQAVQMVGIIQDITAHKQAEQEIQRQATFAHFNPNPVLELSATGSVKYFNAAALQMANMLGQAHPAQILPPQTAAIVRDCLATATASLRLETRAGNRTISWSFFPVARHQVVHCYAGDITERKRVEESHARLALAVEQAAETIVITDTKGEMLYANPAFERTSGYTRAEALGQNLQFLKSDKQAAEFYHRLWTVLEQGKTWSGHFVNRHKDGTLYEEDATISPIRDTQGKIVNYVAVKRDVTREVQLESQFRQVQKMEAIGTLAGGIAHDFNNILAAIFGYGYLLQQDTAGNAPAQESIAEILTAANRAKELVQQILTFSRQREQKREVIRLNLVVREATKFLRASLPAQIKIEIQLADDAPAVLADATQIYQVTMNLATNALHALEGQSGLITVSLASFWPAKTFLQAHPEFRPIQYARLLVADTGHGMDAKTMERIFEPFFTTKPVGKGTGLGLAVVHGLVQAHEGIITVTSAVGQGTTFSLYFPARTDQQPILAETAAGQAANGQGQNILLVDDEPALTMTFQRLLERLHYQVTSCNHAREAIALFRENPARFDLVITDLTMPELNGLEVARQIHALRHELPVILVSGFTPELNREKLRAAGICELLKKPVALPALADALQRALAKP